MEGKNVHYKTFNNKMTHIVSQQHCRMHRVSDNQCKKELVKTKRVDFLCFTFYDV